MPNSDSDTGCQSTTPPSSSQWTDNQDAAEDLGRLAKALGHPARVQIMQLLSLRESCMYGDIAECLPLAQSTVSQHLKILKEAGLIRGTIEGPRVCYCIEPRELSRLKNLVTALYTEVVASRHVKEVKG